MGAGNACDIGGARDERRATKLEIAVIDRDDYTHNREREAVFSHAVIACYERNAEKHGLWIEQYALPPTEQTGKKSCNVGIEKTNHDASQRYHERNGNA